MKVIVAYDISETKNRNMIIELLFFYGFTRVQYSVFLGEIKKKKLKILVKRIENIILNEEDSVYFFQVCERDFNDIKFFGKSINLYYFDFKFLFL